MFSEGRRRHKSSPSDGKKESSSRASPPPGGSSFRRKKQPQHLPTYQSPSASTCNNFLLGGHYYPGKDKKRRHLRKRTIWHRCFCSSPGRMLCSSVLVSYVLLWHVLVPMTHVLLELGKSLSGQGQPDDGLKKFKHLPSIEEEKRFVHHLQGERDEILYGVQHGMLERMKHYKIIVPEWFRIYHKKKGASDSDDLDQKPKSASKSGAKDLEKKPKSESRKEEANVHADEPEIVHEEHHDLPPTIDTGEDHGPKIVDEEHHDLPPNVDSGNDKVQNVDTVNQNAVNATTRRVLRTLQNIDTRPSQSSCPSTLDAQDISTTLIVQSSLDRAWILGETCSRWKDPIVAVVYVRSNEASTTVSSELQTYETKCPHLKFITYTASPGEKKWEYPVNVLRNIGLDAAKTSHIFVADVDFVPSLNLHETIRETLQELQGQEGYDENTSALVVPAFERIPPSPCDEEEDCAAFLKGNSSFIPNTLDDLRGCIREKDCSVFQQSVNWEGHYSTNSESWLNGEWYEETPSDPKNGKETTRRIRTLKCLDSLRYEPYVVLRWCPVSSTKSMVPPVAPYYDERFHGYGKNKIQLISHLRFMDYSFGIMPRGFIVHNPHPESKIKETWNNVEDFDLHSKMDKLYRVFLEELYEKYRDRIANMLAECKHEKQKARQHKAK